MCAIVILAVIATILWPDCLALEVAAAGAGFPSSTSTSEKIEDGGKQQGSNIAEVNASSCVVVDGGKEEGGGRCSNTPDDVLLDDNPITDSSRHDNGSPGVSSSYRNNNGDPPTLDGNDDAAEEQAISSSSYGIDVSWPITQYHISTEEGEPLGNRQAIYDAFMAGCKERYNKDNSCDEAEKRRIETAINQPKKMTNFTEIGFKKVRAPEGLMQELRRFLDKNRQRDIPERGETSQGDSHMNPWDQNMTMVCVTREELYDYNNDDEEVVDGNTTTTTTTSKAMSFRNDIFDAVRPVLNEWMEEGLEQYRTSLIPSAVWGIRIYREGAILAPHVDTLPRIASAIINVDQDVDEPWPLEVYGHDGVTYNITMEPGDMILYESHSIIHGRPFALKGNYFANIFIHFQPVSLLQAATQEGQVHVLRSIGQRYPEDLYRADNNGWQILHEAARAGNVDVLKYLLEEHGGFDVNYPVKSGITSLDLARHFHSVDHPSYQFLLATQQKQQARDMMSSEDSTKVENDLDNPAE